MDMMGQEVAMTENFLRFTIDSLSASYIPFPRFLMEDSLADLSNDATYYMRSCWIEPAFLRSMAL